MSNSSGAQASSGDVTFRLPLNLTQLSSDLAKIAVFCRIRSSAIPPTGKSSGTAGQLYKQEEFPCYWRAIGHDGSSRRACQRPRQPDRKDC